jgi:hypothetical protein
MLGLTTIFLGIVDFSKSTKSQWGEIDRLLGVSKDGKSL